MKSGNVVWQEKMSELFPSACAAHYLNSKQTRHEREGLSEQRVFRNSRKCPCVNCEIKDQVPALCSRVDFFPSVFRVCEV